MIALTVGPITRHVSGEKYVARNVVGNHVTEKSNKALKNIHFPSVKDPNGIQPRFVQTVTDDQPPAGHCQSTSYSSHRLPTASCDLRIEDVLTRCSQYTLLTAPGRRKRGFMEAGIEAHGLPLERNNRKAPPEEAGVERI